MSDLDRRWKRLLDAARPTLPPGTPPASAAFVERTARRGLDARRALATRPAVRRPEPRAWAALGALAVAVVAVLAVARAPVQREVTSLGRALAVLPGRVPAAPALPAPFTLPPAREALALLPEGRALRSAFGLPPAAKDTP